MIGRRLPKINHYQHNLSIPLVLHQMDAKFLQAHHPISSIQPGLNVTLVRHDNACTSYLIHINTYRFDLKVAKFSDHFCQF